MPPPLVVAVSSFSPWHALRSALPNLTPADDLPKLSKATFIGILIAISGNILISLALNLQKLAHKRVQAGCRTQQRYGPMNGKSQRSFDHDNDNAIAGHTPTPLDTRGRYGTEQECPSSSTSVGHDGTLVITNGETQPLIPFPITTGQSPNGYGARTSKRPESAYAPTTPKHPLVSRLTSDSARSRSVPSDAANGGSPTLPSADVFIVGNPVRHPAARHERKLSVIEEGNETDYLKSKLWWLGFVLMNVGETGNFISYAWAPASVVAPLGTFSLIANCLFAPILLQERFRSRDLLGILIAMIGAVTVVVASNSSDTKLDPDTLLHAITQQAFVIYSCIYVVGAIILAGLSQGSLGRKWVFVDVGLCALFGGFTVLSTKAISTLLTMEWIEMFTKWITYPILAVLILTGVGQIRYLNRALMRFDSKVVIPVQFVLFTLSAIIGSAILYGDFRKAKFHQIVTFLYGCAATFLGVFIIAWAPSSEDDDTTLEDFQDDGTDARSTLTLTERRVLAGSIGRRRRTTVLIPSHRRRDNSVPRSPALSLMGLSPAQHLLLVHNAPVESPTSGDVPERRRTMSWLDDAQHDQAIRGATSEPGLARRFKDNTSSPRIGSLDQNSYYG